MKYCLRISSFDSQVLEAVLTGVVVLSKKCGIFVTVARIGLPRRRSRFTVLRSPHVDKKSREQYEHLLHSSLVTFVSLRDSVSFLKFFKKIKALLFTQPVEWAYTYQTAGSLTL